MPALTAPLTTRQKNKLDKQITEIHRVRCSGWAINIMNISKVFQAGYAAAIAGASIEEAVVAKATELRENG